MWVPTPPPSGVFLSQPNRFGLFEDVTAIDRLDVPVTVVVRPTLAGWVPLPANVVAVIDYLGEPAVEADRPEAERLADLTGALMARIRQLGRVRLLAGKSLGAVTLLLPLAARTVADGLRTAGVRIDDPLADVSSLIATLRPTHTLQQISTFVDIVGATLQGETPPQMPDATDGTRPPRRRTLTYHRLP